MKKNILTIICVLFTSTSFAQMVGANSISKQSTSKTTLGVEKHEFSIHGGMGFVQGEEGSVLEAAFAGILKYKYKPSEKYDIRFLAETEILDVPDVYAPSVIPILVGVNYERRLNNNLSVFADLGTGISIPLTESIDRNYYVYSHESFYGYDDFRVGFAFSPEIGFSYKNFMFSFKYLFSYNQCRLDYFNHDYFDRDYDYESHYFLFTLGYRF